MPIPNDAFRAGDVYVDYPQEDVKFRAMRDTGKIYRRFNGEIKEVEIPYTSDLFSEAQRLGVMITAEDYQGPTTAKPPKQ